MYKELERRTIWHDDSFFALRRDDGWWFGPGGWAPRGNCVMRFDSEKHAAAQRDFGPSNGGKVEIVPVEVIVLEVDPQP